ncbi:MAG: hypothetical protein CUN53_00925 [Phototrophicales bacterium]|nr:MAG: hypothetical protein CUN53_00925 [Phototrophicales bacterium]
MGGAHLFNSRADRAGGDAQLYSQGRGHPSRLVADAVSGRRRGAFAPCARLQYWHHPFSLAFHRRRRVRACLLAARPETGRWVMGDKVELNRQISAFYDDYHRGRPRQPDAWMQKHYWTSFIGATLEVGGGTLYPDRRDYAVVDLSAEAVRRARARSIPALVADGSRLPFRSGAFDTAACHDVLEHVTDPEGFIAEICRVARSRLVIAGPNYIDGEPGHLDRRLPRRVLRFLFQPESRLQALNNPHLTFDDQWQPDRDAVCAANAPGSRIPCAGTAFAVSRYARGR